MPDSNAPEDPLGTVRVEPDHRGIAVRGIGEDDGPIWYVVNTSEADWAFEFPDLTSWRVVYGGDA